MVDGHIEKNRILLVSQDKEFAGTSRTAFAASNVIEFAHADCPIADLNLSEITDKTGVIVVDLDKANLETLEAFQRIKRRISDRIPVVTVVKEYDAAMVRILVQLQIADFLMKPVKTADLVRACLRALKGPQENANEEAEIYTFKPAAGGVGNTVLAIQSAFLLHRSSREAATTCLVDLNFQQGSCAEYLDLEPRFAMSEVQQDADRLDHHLLDALMSKHESGLAVLAAPNNPVEQRSFDPKVVIRVLDLVSAYFDNVVLDLPRTWYPWTETILRGSNHVFVTSEMTVPCMRHTQRLIKAIEQETEKTVKPKVIVNRFATKMSDEALNASDAKQVLGDYLVGGISNNYKLVREAVDRGVPLETIDPDANVISDLRRIILPDEVDLTAQKSGKSLFGRAGGLFKRAS